MFKKLFLKNCTNEKEKEIMLFFLCSVDYIYAYINGKMRSVETILGLRGGGIKKNDGGGEFNYDIA
jgi:hypothetical protein